jgi:thioredoxin 1
VAKWILQRPSPCIGHVKRNWILTWFRLISPTSNASSLSWCDPCKLIAPYLDTYRNQFDIAVAKIDTERSEELSSKFDIHAIPTFVLLKKASGEVSVVDIVVSAHVDKLKKLFENA